MKFLLLTIVVLSCQAIAQKPAGESERAKLAFLVGSYTTETAVPTMASAKKGTNGRGTSVIAWALDSSFLLIDEQSVNPLFGRYKGHGVLGFDAPSKQLVLSMFNNYGDHPSYKGSFVGDTLVLITTVPMPGRSFDQKLVWYKDGGGLKLKVLNDMGKGFVPVLEQTATPVSPERK